ncbi:hypothetical protein DFJ58DRAFT_665155 [Suillus subalutaceus]|uniref:uncharacterized protein n=1 Tax=Suillus subalutaceus TaxID=48586 RepID=UPI001B8771DF|nr:uncharacterized protein DFJ58DRAFT_665155 [Suillus subalutaceus]KAG1843784.1 hypothetical protein DFJ58DRAFT_665155 [Suillus subalutaceus]
MNKAGTKLPENISILSARKLPHGGILYEFNTPTSTEWINIPANRSNILNHFGTDIIIKEHAYHLLLENVPISFDPNSKIILAEMEWKGGLEQDDIMKAQYIKPVARRSINQRTAHVAITLKTKKAANQIIRHRISMEGKKVYGRKAPPGTNKMPQMSIIRRRTHRSRLSPKA